MSKQASQKKRQVEVTSVFEKNYDSTAPIVLNRGGARSSKSYSLAQLFCHKYTNEVGKSFLITRKTLPALRRTAYKVMIDMLDDYGYLPYIFHNKTFLELSCPRTKNWMVFTSIDDPEKIKSTEWHYAWMEEATEFTHDDFKMIMLRMSGKNDRPNQVFMSFNPVDAFHWIKTEVADKRSDVLDIPSTYLDNPFLPEQYIKTLLALKHQDPNYWKVYGLGEWGVLEGLIYTNWQTVPKAPCKYDETIYGLDFGFNNPMALVEIGLCDGMVCLEEKLYQTGMTTGDLIAKLPELVPNRSAYIYADSAEPDRIEEIRRAGWNVHPSIKGKNSVRDGIDVMKRKKLTVINGSINLISELRAYKWKEDKDGRVLDEPVKFNDHLMDAARYAVHSYEKQARPMIEVI